MKNYYLIFVGVLLLFFSCISYLTPNMTGDNNIAYLPRPLNADSTKSKIYISGEYAYSSPRGYLKMKSGLINVSRGHNLKQVNFAYGAFGFFGNASYQDTTTDRYSSKTIENFRKSFYGFGLRSTIGLHYVKNNFTFRYINWENAFSSEKGDYTNYRNILYNSQRSNGDETVYVSKQSMLYTTGLSSEIIYNNAFDNENSKFGLRGFIGITPNLKSNFRNINNGSIEPFDNKLAISINAYFTFKRIFSTIQLGSEINTSLKFGLGYSF